MHMGWVRDQGCVSRCATGMNGSPTNADALLRTCRLWRSCLMSTRGHCCSREDCWRWVRDWALTKSADLLVCLLLRSWALLWSCLVSCMQCHINA